MLEDLRTGEGGVQFVVPRRFTPTSSSHVFVSLEAEPGHAWTLHRSDRRLDLDPVHAELHRRDVERHTRAMFASFARTLVSRGHPPAPLRTEDASWSPLVSMEVVDLDGHAALTVVHRMSYQPGHETMMGHVLVPVQTGLFEIRIIAHAARTGVRESVLTAAALRAFPDEDPEVLLRRLGQRHFDDPVHDATFPDHPLGIVRAHLREIVDGGLITVTEPAPRAPAGETELADLGCALTVPPRFLRTDNPSLAQWSRVAFACTDGIQLFSVARDPAGWRSGDVARLVANAEQIARRTPAEALAVEVEARAGDEASGRAQAIVYRSYDVPDDESQHTVFHWLIDDDGGAVVMVLGGPACVPKQEMLDEVKAVAESWRPLPRRPAPPRPWWKIW